mmetsp:Transcript_40698/g.90487  ORF Transcript_40698/g.90487 Transcript_40698/m.90487 type:complete len:260 (-) Transcript_40698:1687-2466(-)
MGDGDGRSPGSATSTPGCGDGWWWWCWYSLFIPNTLPPVPPPGLPGCMWLCGLSPPGLPPGDNVPDTTKGLLLGSSAPDVHVSRTDGSEVWRRGGQGGSLPTCGWELVMPETVPGSGTEPGRLSLLVADAASSATCCDKCTGPAALPLSSEAGAGGKGDVYRGCAGSFLPAAAVAAAGSLSCRGGAKPAVSVPDLPAVCSVGFGGGSEAAGIEPLATLAPLVAAAGPPAPAAAAAVFGLALISGLLAARSVTDLAKTGR